MRRTRFITWCKKDTNDTRKINYTLHTYYGETVKFTSDEEFHPSFLGRLQKAWIISIELKNNEWYAELKEDN